MGPGVALIAAERQRQVDVLQWTADHDASQDDQELTTAAWCYLGDLLGPDGLTAEERLEEPSEWPWPDDDFGCSWKPTPADPVRQLVKAGALVAAEIDRLLAVPSARRGRPEVSDSGTHLEGDGVGHSASDHQRAAPLPSVDRSADRAPVTGGR